MTPPGRIVVLNGAPRSGKSSIAAAIQGGFEGFWINLGVDAWMRMSPERFHPALGLRPGGERPDLEPLVAALYAALYESAAAHSRLGLNVVLDTGHHDAHSRPLGILADCARRVAGLPVLFVGVHCPLDVILARRASLPVRGPTRYETAAAGAQVPPTVLSWAAVHDPGIYDLELDTTALDPPRLRHPHRRSAPPRRPAPDRLRAARGRWVNGPPPSQPPRPTRMRQAISPAGRIAWPFAPPRLRRPAAPHRLRQRRREEAQDAGAGLATLGAVAA